MDAPSDRLCIRKNSGGNAHFLDEIASQVAVHVAKWRAEIPELWKPRYYSLDEARLRAFLERAASKGLAPKFVSHVILGSEWLFRARPLTQSDVEAHLDEIEQRLRRSVLADWKPWLAALVVGSIAQGVIEGLERTHYMVSLRQWAAPTYDWRSLLADRDGGSTRRGYLLDSSKSGKIPRLSPILASLIIERAVENTSLPRSGSKALALELASILFKRKIQPGEFNVWRRAIEIPAPSRPTGMPNDYVPPSNFRDWLVQRWMSSHYIAFAERNRDWAEYTFEAAHNPLALFAPVADLEVISLLYSLSWYHEVSRRRPTVKKRPVHKVSKKGRRTKPS